MKELREIFKSDQDLIEAIWINYPDNREVREKLAYEKWQELYLGENRYNNQGEFSEVLSVLDVFMEFSKGNEKLCTKLVKDLYIKVREKYNPTLVGNSERVHLEHRENNGVTANDDIGEMWQGIKEEVEEEFQIEYEKMKRIMDIFDDISLFAQVGWDLSHFSREDMFVISKLNEVFDNREEIKQLLDNIGKVEKEKKSNKSSKIRDYGIHSEEVMGITLGNDLSNLLPSELSLLHHKTLKKYFYIKYNESRLFNYDLRGFSDDDEKSKEKKKGKGPIILCIDNSSSMDGVPEELAKGSALYILKKAYREGRRVYLISFGSEGEISEFDLTNEENGLFFALQFLRKKFFGGTDFITPLKRSIELIKSESYIDADLLFITDGLGKVPNSFLNWVESAKKSLDFKIHSLLINEKEQEMPFSDRNLYYKTGRR